MPQYLLQAEDIPAQHEITHGKSMPEYMGTDTTICQISALTEALEKHLYTVKRQRRTILSKEYMILISIPYLLQLIIALTPAIQVIQ